MDAVRRSSKMPALFLGHGSPMNAIEDNEFHRGWRAAAARLPAPAAVLCVSAHWETRGVSVTAADQPETIHDFQGFPQALFAVQYPAPGAPDLARRVAELLAPEPVALDQRRGLDHGAWSVLAAMYPDAGVPVVELSLDTSRPGSFHYALARKLAPLRDAGVLILGSGNLVHNLALFRYHDRTPFDWAVRFDQELRRRLEAGDHQALLAPHLLGPAAALAVPTPEHYLPLLYAAALQQPGEGPSFFNGAVLSSISMTSVLIGSPGGAAAAPRAK